MKKQLLTALLIGTAVAGNAQAVNDTVVLGAGYANQVWYSLANDEQGSSAKDNWDIGFDVVNIMSSLHVNTHGGAKLWIYPKGDKTVFGATLDTNGLGTWAERFNSPTSWEAGAMGAYVNPNDPFDVDWGTYDINTHVISGDSVYIIKLVNDDFKQLFIEKLASGTFHFKFADLDGSNVVAEQVSKSSFTDKSLGYYSIVNKTTVNREPNIDKWELSFMQYGDLSGSTMMRVTGVLHNRDRNIQVAQTAPLADAATNVNWQAQTFQPDINTIGYDWKTFDMNTFKYTTNDSIVYFISIEKENVGHDIWKLRFTDFASADGSFAFSKQRLQTASVKDVNGGITSLALYPNPVNGGDVHVAYNVPAGSKALALTVTDITGKVVLAQQLDNNSGLHAYTIPSNTLRSGMYIVSVSSVGGRVQQKLVVN